MIDLHKTFTVKDDIYKLHIYNDYSVAFELIYGLDINNKSLTRDIFGHLSGVRETLGSRNPITTIRTVIKLLNDILYKNNLPYFTFSANGASRIKLYDRLVKIYSNIGGYKFTHSYETENNKYYLFIK